MGRPLLDWQLAAWKQAGQERFFVVTGYRGDMIRKMGLEGPENPRWDQTNMVVSLDCSYKALEAEEDVILTYSDIIFEPAVAQAILNSKEDCGVVVDRGFWDLWSFRMEDPLSDIESLTVDASGAITSIGQKVEDPKQVEAQYLGLMRFKGAALEQLKTTINRLRSTDGFDNMYMTDLLQTMANDGLRLGAVPIRHGWLEVDSVEDLERYEAAQAQGKLAPLMNLNTL